jgi:hypothetical protein
MTASASLAILDGKEISQRKKSQLLEHDHVFTKETTMPMKEVEKKEMI